MTEGRFEFRKVDSPNPEDPAGEDRRRQMITYNTPAAFKIMREIKDKDQVIVLADIQNCPVARTIVNSAGSSRTVEKLTKQANEMHTSMIPTVIMQIPRWTFYRNLRLIQKQLHKMEPSDPSKSPIVQSLASPAKAEHFYLMAVSRGKALIQLPLEGVDEITENIDYELKSEELSEFQGGKIWYNIIGNHRFSSGGQL